MIFFSPVSDLLFRLPEPVVCIHSSILQDLYMTIRFPVKLALTSKTQNLSVVVVCISLTSNASARIYEKSIVGKCYIWLFLASDIKP